MQDIPADDCGDFVIGPAFSPAFEEAPERGLPIGRIISFTLSSRDSRIYPGIKRLENDVTRRRDAFGNRIAADAQDQSVASPFVRTVWVYVPQQYVQGEDAPFIVAQDGHFYLNRLPSVLDRLIAEGRLPVLVAVLVDNGGGDAQGSQRGLEYDTLSSQYCDFIEFEVLPQVRAIAGVELTNDPNRRVTMGVSSGAACAFTMAWFHPDRYRRVISYSGSFVNQQSPMDPITPRGAWEYHATLIPSAEPKPIRIWLEVGDQDLHADDPEESWHNWPLANTRMAQALAAQGYAYRFTLSKGGRHADARVVDQTLPSALEWIWRG